MSAHRVIRMSTKIRRLNYDDRVSTFWTWFKVGFLAPPWAIPMIPYFGMLMAQTPDVCYQIGYVALLLACGVHFADDILKKSIKVDEELIRFGLKKYRLSQLQSVGLRYKKDSISPDSAIFHFKDSVKLKLYLSRLKWNEFEDLLRYVENKVPHCKIDPVLLTLMKCKKNAGKSLSELGDSVSLAYNSRKSIKELAASFMDTAEQWSKSGPIIGSLVCIPLWGGSLAGLYLTGKLSAGWHMETLSVNQISMKLLVNLYEQLGKVLEYTGKSFVDTVGNNISIVLMILMLLPAIWWLLKLAVKPNLVVLNSDSLTMRFRLWSINIPTLKVPLSEITAARLFIPQDNSAPDKWELRLERHQKRSVNLMLSSLTSEDRQQLLRALQKWAPHAVIDTELTEALLPKQERSYTELWLQSLSQSPERRSLEPLSPGQELQDGRFQIIRTLGVGGQGTAYLCKDTALMMDRLNQYVVLKETIFPVFVDQSVRQQALERFEQEARLLSKFDSDNIVRLSDYFLEDHRGYLVLEHVDGTNLRQLVSDKGALSADQVRNLARQMCDILTVLHEEGIVHRDFTPDNLILSKDGQLKLIDFNVAHQTESGFSGTIVGKHAFLPPEQFRGKAEFASDIYAMGATIYFLLTGQDPEPITQSDPRKVDPTHDVVLSEVVRQATFLDSKKRFATIDDIRVALEMHPALMSEDDHIGSEAGEPSTTGGASGQETLHQEAGAFISVPSALLEEALVPGGLSRSAPEERVVEPNVVREQEVV